MPPWLDGDFYGLALSLACLGNSMLYGFERLDQLRRKPLDMEQIEREAAQIREMMLKAKLEIEVIKNG